MIFFSEEKIRKLAFSILSSCLSGPNMDKLYRESSIEPKYRDSAILDDYNAFYHDSFMENLVSFSSLIRASDDHRPYLNNFSKKLNSSIEIITTISSSRNIGDHQERYDVVFDLFGNFNNGVKLEKSDLNNPLSAEELKLFERYGITSWEKIFTNHRFLSGRTHLRLQKVDKELHPLFEARRIGLMTPTEFKQGQSRVHLGSPQEDYSSPSVSI